MKTLRHAAALVPALAIAACAAGPYPSLAPRTVETRSWAEPVPTAPTPVAADPALDARIAVATGALASSAAAFAVADGRATPLVARARGAAAGSERWIAAQSALAELDAVRAATGEASGTLEDMGATRAEASQPDYPPLEAARTGAGRQLDDEAARIRALQDQLPAG